ncbi:hypothetical protein ACOSP7_022957 [Xanthoceras sorbifolium]
MIICTLNCYRWLKIAKVVGLTGLIPSKKKYLIDLCLHEVNNGFRSGGTLKPCAWTRIAEGLERLCWECVSVTGSHNWISGMKRIPKIGNTTSTSSSPMYCDSYVRLLDEDENMSNTLRRNKKKRKVDETCEEISKIVSVLEKSNSNGPSVTDCFLISKRFLNFEDPLYFIVTNALYKRKEN